MWGGIGSVRRTRSISHTERRVTSTLPTFMSTAIVVTVAAEIPFCERKVDEKLKALLMPLNCCTAMHVMQILSPARVERSRSICEMPYECPGISSSRLS